MLFLCRGGAPLRRPAQQTEDMRTFLARLTASTIPQHLPTTQKKAEKSTKKEIDGLLPPTYDEAISPTLDASPSSTTEITPLPLPIIIPQRRPRTAVSMSVQVTVRMAMAAQVKGHTNSFIEKANKEIFWPVGYHAMVTTFMPGQAQQVVDVDVDVNTSLRQNPTNADDNGNGTRKSCPSPISTSNPHGRRSRLRCRTLFVEEISSFVTEYFDKRARAEHPDAYNTINSPNDGSTGTKKPKFASRYSDPNHPVNSGSPISLLTGGIVNPRGWAEKCGGAALLGGGAGAGGDRGGLLSKVQDIKRSRDSAGPIGLLRSNISSRSSTSQGRFELERFTQPGGLKQVVRKATTMHRDVLYLVIAEIPDHLKEEMRRMERS